MSNRGVKLETFIRLHAKPEEEDEFRLTPPFPIAEYASRAWERGVLAGVMRSPEQNPYVPDSPHYAQLWWGGYAAGRSW